MEINAEPVDVDLRLPFCANYLIIGATNVGKTYNVLRMLADPTKVFKNVPIDEPDFEIIYLYGAYQDKFIPFENCITFLKGWDHPQLSTENLLKTRNKFYVIDDCYSGDSVAGEKIRHMMVTLGHHQHYGILLLIHHLFSHSIKHLREISLNAGK